MPPRKCPLCRQVMPTESQFTPFCSERCKVLDLGAWASESYKIAAEPVDLEEVHNELGVRGQGQEGEDDHVSKGLLDERSTKRVKLH